MKVSVTTLKKKLTQGGVELRLKTKVASFDGQEVALEDGTKIATCMLIWTAGTTPPPLLSSLPCVVAARSRFCQ